MSLCAPGISYMWQLEISVHSFGCTGSDVNKTSRAVFLTTKSRSIMGMESDWSISLPVLSGLSYE